MSPTSKPSPGAGQTRILIVPDDLMTWEIRESFLDRSSFVVRTAAGAEHALAISEVWQPTLVMFRSKLEGMPVTRFCADVKSTSVDGITKLLMLTDHVGPGGEDAADAASDVHLITPVDIHQLLDTIAELIGVTQRTNRRVGLEVLVHAEGFSDGDQAADTALCTSQNVSEEGLLLECSRSLPIGSTGVLQFFLPASSERISVRGTVRMALDEVRLHYVVEFLDLPPQHRAQIREYVQTAGTLT